MVKCSVFFAVRAEFLNIILTSFGFKGLRTTVDGLNDDILHATNKQTPISMNAGTQLTEAWWTTQG
jgi:hypothetical protein